MGKVIIIDPGHGLNENGIYARPLIDCTGDKAIIVPNSMYPQDNDYADGFYREDTGTLRIALNAVSYLTNMGHTVLSTRADNRNAKIHLSSLTDSEWKKQNWRKWKWVREFTKENNADIFVSIHTNAGRGRGCSAFWAEPVRGESLCRSITDELNNQLDLKVRRIDKRRYMILRDVCKGRACLVECLFHDNTHGMKLLLNNNGYDKMAKALADGIDAEAKKF